MKIISFSLLLFFSLMSNNLTAQTYTLAADSSVSITITGTSTLHGWTVTAKKVTNVPEQLNLENGSIDQFNFSVDVNSMDGGRGASMNKKTQVALKASEHPNITFQLESPVSIGDFLSVGTFKANAKGTMTIAGVERAATVEVSGEQKADWLILKGSKPLKFSELDIEPPSAMFGQIVCGDDIFVNFEFRYKKSN